MDRTAKSSPLPSMRVETLPSCSTTYKAAPLVVRLRKQVIYGREEAWNPAGFHADYAPVGL